MWKDVIEELTQLTKMKFAPPLHIVNEIDKLTGRIKLSVGKKSLISEEESKLSQESTLVIDEISVVKNKIENLEKELSKPKKSKLDLDKVVDREATVIFGGK